MFKIEWFIAKGGDILANKIKGLTLEIGGETTALESALKGVNKTSRNLQSELREVEKLLKLDPDNTELLAQKQKLLSDSVGNTSKKLETLKSAAEQAQNQLERGEISEEQFRALQREVIKTENELTRLGDKAKDAGTQFDYLGTKADKMNGFMKKAGLGVAAVGVGLVGIAVKAGKSADEINTLSTQTGLSTEQIQKFQYASDRIDVSLDTLTGSMAKLTKNMATAKKGTGEAAGAFEELGVSFKDDVTGELRNNQDVFNDTIAALGKIENETQRDALAMQIFGKSAQELNPLIEGGADALTKLGKEAEDAGLIMSQDALDGANAFNDGLDKLKVQSEAAFAKVGGEIAENLLPALEDIIQAISDLVSWILDNKDSVISALAGIAAGIAAFNVVVMIQSLIGAFKKWKVATEGMTVAQRALNLVQAANPMALIITLIATLVTALIVLWKTNEDFRNKVIEIWNKVKEIVSGVVDSLVKFFTETLPEALKTMIEWFSELPGKVIQFFSDLLEKISDWGKDVIGWIADNVPKFILNIVDFYAQLPGKVWETLVNVVNKLTEWGSNVIDWIAKNVPEFILRIVNFYAELPGKIWSHLVDAVRKLGEWISNMISKVKSEVPAIIDNITEFFEELPGKLKDIGIDIIKGLWDGIKSMKNWISDKVSGFVGGITDSVKGVLGISSPSTVFRDEVGKMIGVGMAEGITESKKTVADALTGLSNQLSAGLNINPADLDPGATELTLNTNLTLDSKTIAATTSKVQASRNSFKARSLGVVT